MLPEFLTHYYHDSPFQSITDLPTREMVGVISELRGSRWFPRRLLKPVYFLERRRYEQKMREQFVAKGGCPRRRNPRYLVLGESEIWEELAPRKIRIPLADIPDRVVSFTYTDSWYAYVDFDLNRRPIPRKPQYEMVYRAHELNDLVSEFGFPGERRKTDEDCEHDYYMEAQVWDDEPLQRFASQA